MPSLPQVAALSVVVLTGLYFLTLGVALLAYPEQGRRFLLGFAQSARVHFAEMAVRIAVGSALVIAASRMRFSPLFTGFGLALLISSTLLLCFPWRWHRAFAVRVLPAFTQHLRFVGLVSFLIGALLLAATFAGAA
jgi:uncharacterized protein YjeT (DUF2065 family)